MIICVCNNVSHSTIEQYSSLGVDSLNELQDHISVSNKCRKCESCVVSMLTKNNFSANTSLNNHIIDTSIANNSNTFANSSEASLSDIAHPVEFHYQSQNSLDILNDKQIKDNVKPLSEVKHLKF